MECRPRLLRLVEAVALQQGGQDGAGVDRTRGRVDRTKLDRAHQCHPSCKTPVACQGPVAHSALTVLLNCKIQTLRTAFAIALLDTCIFLHHRGALGVKRVQSPPTTAAGPRQASRLKASAAQGKRKRASGVFWLRGYLCAA